MPDLGRGFVKSFKQTSSIDDFEFQNLYAGCSKHYEADKIFHASEFFKWGSKVCVDLLKVTPFQELVERRWFIGHVLFEMLLDRILVRHKPKVLSDFYENLNLADTQTLQKFFILNHSVDIEKFMNFFIHFRRVGYIKNYTDNNLFVYSLNRLFMRAKLPPLSLYDQVLMQECLLFLEDTEFKRVDELLLRLKQVFE